MRDGGREGAREGGSEGGREGAREGWREGGREGGREGWREGEREGGRDGGREGREVKEPAVLSASSCSVRCAKYARHAAFQKHSAEPTFGVSYWTHCWQCMVLGLGRTWH